MSKKLKRSSWEHQDFSSFAELAMDHWSDHRGEESYLVEPNFKLENGQTLKEFLDSYIERGVSERFLEKTLEKMADVDQVYNEPGGDIPLFYTYTTIEYGPYGERQAKMDLWVFLRKRDFEVLQEKLEKEVKRHPRFWKSSAQKLAKLKKIEAELKKLAEITFSKHSSLTFAEARKKVMDNLKADGWTVKENLKIPWAQKEDVRLWFKPQAIWFTKTNHTLQNARSTGYDVKEVAEESLIQKIFDTIKTYRDSGRHSILDKEV